jgi:2-phospho-L-lactate transferase/gluconeogenesis factor (CofD/UPF0052 family)
MTKFGETHNFKVSDFINHLESFVGRRVDGILYNEARPSPELQDLYAKQKSVFVEMDDKASFLDQRQLFRSDLLDSNSDVVRHNSNELAKLIETIFSSGAS